MNVRMHGVGHNARARAFVHSVSRQYLQITRSRLLSAPLVRAHYIDTDSRPQQARPRPVD